MNSMKIEPTITIPVDLCNPGQFLACCGLLELAHRLIKPGNRALGWFEEVDKSKSRFLIAAFKADSPIYLSTIIKHIKQCEISSKNPEAKEGPVFLRKPFDLCIDWRSPFPQNNLIKTFAGKQNIFEIIQALQKAIPENIDEKLMNFLCPVEKAVTAFGIEKAEGSIDAGFSMDVQSDHLFRHPPVFLELLALIGSQRFCLKGGQKKFERIYYAWLIPLTVNLASISVSQPLSGIPAQGYYFTMYKRDPKGRYKGFATSRMITL